MADYLASVQQYDSEADPAIVDKIVKHCGIALQNRDSSTVATSDSSEVQRVKDGFCTKKLGLEPEQADQAVAAATEDMKASNAKCRVAFYYLTAKHADKLSVFA